MTEPKGKFPATGGARPNLKVAKPGAGHDWRDNLISKKDGQYARCLANVMSILAADPDWADVLAYNAFTETVVATRPPPAREIDAPKIRIPGDWGDTDSTRTVAWIAQRYGFEPTVMQVEQAVQSVAQCKTMHPVCSYLRGLAWDGVPRLDSMLSVYFGVQETAYSVAVGARWMISAVARVFKPGCQADCMLILEGSQGRRKSTGLEALFGAAWFSDTGFRLGDKDAYQGLRSKWGIEVAELDAFKGRDVTKVKSFVSARSDNYRPSYGHRSRDFPRQCVFAGSTNEYEYLEDTSGGRRFWPVTCLTDIDVAAIHRDRGQLWAEARHRYDAGEAWHVDTPELRALCEAEQAKRTQVHPWLQNVGAWLVKDLSRADRGVTTGEVLQHGLGFDLAKITKRESTIVGGLLRELGWAPGYPELSEGARVRRYRPTIAQPAQPHTDSGCAHEPEQKPLPYQPAQPAQPAQPKDSYTHETEGES